jgi:hypothetical protein
MALAIAVQMMQHAWLPEYRVDQEPGEGTMGYIEARMYGDGFRIGTPNGVNRMRLRRKKIGSTTVRGQYGPPT